MDEKIKNILLKICPAFNYDRAGGPALWHRCKCRAREDGTCICVWHETNHCEAGVWKQLEFVITHRMAAQASRREALNEAETACLK